jgi:CheY-like chemotaxis protein
MVRPMTLMPPPSGASDQTSPQQRVLVVDDNADSADLLELFLRRAGHDARAAATARAALAVAPDFRPHVALIDIGLPDMDGYTLTNRLRAMPELRECRFIAVTGHTSHSAIARSIAAGFEAHLSKPVNVDDVLNLIARSNP